MAKMILRAVVAVIFAFFCYVPKGTSDMDCPLNAVQGFAKSTEKCAATLDQVLGSTKVVMVGDHAWTELMALYIKDWHQNVSLPSPPMNVIKDFYDEKCRIPSDINEHLPTLMSLTKECDSVAELGVRGVVSTWAFLHGLVQGVPPPEGTKKQIYSVDIEPAPGIQQVEMVACIADIALEFIQHDSASVVLPPVDLLFIDTWHVYGHLKRELAFHHANAKKYIVMHDTEVDGIHGESLRLGMPVQEQSVQSGYPEDEITRGLKFAVDEFLQSHPEWVLHKHYYNNNGLTVLKRV